MATQETTREHGTHACYVWGPGPGRGRGCRCDACRAGHRAAEARRERAKLYGQWRPFVNAEPVRRHVQMLRDAGVGLRTVAARAGLSRSVIQQLTDGKPGRPPTRRMRLETAAAIMAVRPTPATMAPSTVVDATGTRRRLQALVAIGWTQTDLAARLGMTVSNFGDMLRRDQVLAATARNAVRLYDELWDKPPAPGRYANLARKYAASRGWPPPLAWDDDALDDPAGRPADGWQRGGRTRPRSRDLVEDAAELIGGQGYTRDTAAARLGVTRGALGAAMSRTRKRAAA